MTGSAFFVTPNYQLKVACTDSFVCCPCCTSVRRTGRPLRHLVLGLWEHLKEYARHRSMISVAAASRNSGRQISVAMVLHQPRLREINHGYETSATVTGRQPRIWGRCCIYGLELIIDFYCQQFSQRF